MQHAPAKPCCCCSREAELDEIVKLVGVDALLAGRPPDAGSRAFGIVRTSLQQDAFA